MTLAPGAQAGCGLLREVGALAREAGLASGRTPRELALKQGLKMGVRAILSPCRCLSIRWKTRHKRLIHSVEIPPTKLGVFSGYISFSCEQHRIKTPRKIAGANR